MIVHVASLIKLLIDSEPAFQVTLVLVERLPHSLWVWQQWYVGFYRDGKKRKSYVTLHYVTLYFVALLQVMVKI